MGVLGDQAHLVTVFVGLVGVIEIVANDMAFGFNADSSSMGDEITGEDFEQGGLPEPERPTMPMSSPRLPVNWISLRSKVSPRLG